MLWTSISRIYIVCRIYRAARRIMNRCVILANRRSLTLSQRTMWISVQTLAWLIMSAVLSWPATVSGFTKAWAHVLNGHYWTTLLIHIWLMAMRWSCRHTCLNISVVWQQVSSLSLQMKFIRLLIRQMKAEFITCCLQQKLRWHLFTEMRSWQRLICRRNSSLTHHVSEEKQVLTERTKEVWSEAISSTR